MYYLFIQARKQVSTTAPENNIKSRASTALLEISFCNAIYLFTISEIDFAKAV